VVDRTCIVEEGSKDFLYTFGVGGVESGGCLGRLCIVFCTVLGNVVLVW